MRYALVVLLLLLSPAPAQASEIGGFTLTAHAAPVSVLLHTDLLPVPAEPQGEVHLSYTQTELGSGPIGRSVASSLWPGAAVGTGLPQLLGFAYPVQANAAHPGGPADESKSGMRAQAGAFQGRVGYAGAKQEVPFLLTPTGSSSNSSSAVTASEARSIAVTSAQTITLLSGLVVMSGVRFESVAVSDGGKGSGTSTFSIAEFTVLGQKFPVKVAGRAAGRAAEGVGTTGSHADLAQSATKLEGHGGDVRQPRPDPDRRRAGVAHQARPRRNPGRRPRPLLPKELAPLLNPLRKMVVIVGDTEAVANASAATPLTPARHTGPAGTGTPTARLGRAAATSPARPRSPAIAPSSPVTPVASARAKPRSLLDFPGVPALLVIAGLGVAAMGANGMRSIGAFLLGGAPCPSGHPTGVPDLRNG